MFIGIANSIGQRFGGGGAAPFVGLLDTYSGAAAAYSLRQLSSSYSGSAIRVRRASDNTEQDIGFSNNELDTTSLASFCSGTNGFVTTWYDQSGNGYNVTQATASAQPQIVSNGSVFLINGKPAIFSNGVSRSKFLKNTTNPSTNSPVTDFFAFKVNSFISGIGYQAYYDGGSTQTQRGFFGYQASNSKDIAYDGAILEGYTSSTNQTLATIVRNSTSSNIYKNNSLQVTGNTGTYSPFVGLTFGEDYQSTNAPSDIYYQEFIRYSGVSSNISAINTNINGFYSIY